MYRPLPKELTIKNSPIEGLGLFATKDIKANSFIGITHIRDEQFENKYIRTPLGGFYNHSNDPTVMRMVSDSLPTLKLSFSSTGFTTVLTFSLYFFAKSKSLWSCAGHPKTAPKP